MVATNKLEEITRKCRIITSFSDLSESILGYYYCDGRYDIILINNSIQSDERLYRCVLAEEIGHYRTTIGDITPRKYMCYRDRLELDKKEQLALHWATDFLIPTKMLLSELKKNNSPSLKNISDQFFVTEDFMMRKLEFMSNQNCEWDIDGKRILYLYNFPSVHIFEKI